MMTENQLSKLRDQVDEINLEILKLLNKRAEIVLQIGNAKKNKVLIVLTRFVNVNP